MLERPESTRRLAERLQTCPQVARYGPDEAPTLAHDMTDLEQSFRSFLDERLPGLVTSSTAEEVESALGDIREEFRHILYHIADARFFRTLFPVELR